MFSKAQAPEPEQEDSRRRLSLHFAFISQDKFGNPIVSKLHFEGQAQLGP
jgi:hypothetical protein